MILDTRIPTVFNWKNFFSPLLSQVALYNLASKEQPPRAISYQVGGEISPLLLSPETLCMHGVAIGLNDAKRHLTKKKNGGNSRSSGCVPKERDLLSCYVIAVLFFLSTPIVNEWEYHRTAANEGVSFFFVFFSPSLCDFRERSWSALESPLCVDTMTLLDN